MSAVPVEIPRLIAAGELRGEVLEAAIAHADALRSVVTARARARELEITLDNAHGELARLQLQATNAREELERAIAAELAE